MKPLPGMISNLFAGIPECLPEELFECLAESDSVRIERIISHGHVTADGDWYDQEWDEWVLLLSGSAALQFEGEEGQRILEQGDFILIPAHCRHRVAWTDRHVKSVWLAVHFKGGGPGV